MLKLTYSKFGLVYIKIHSADSVHDACLKQVKNWRNFHEQDPFDVDTGSRSERNGRIGIRLRGSCRALRASEVGHYLVLGVVWFRVSDLAGTCDHPLVNILWFFGHLLLRCQESMAATDLPDGGRRTTQNNYRREHETVAGIK